MIVIKEQWWDVITMIIWYRKSGPNPMACSWKIQWISHIKVFWLPAKKVKGVVPTFTYPRMLLRLMTILGDIVNHHWWCHSILVRMGGVEMVRQSLRFNNNSTNIYFPNLAEISDNWIPLLAASYPDELLAPLSIIRTLAIIIITITVIIITITIITIIALITIIVIYLISKTIIITQSVNLKENFPHFPGFLVNSAL